MQITATFESIEEMQSFAKQIAGETEESVKAEKTEKKSVKTQEVNQEPQTEPELLETEAELTGETDAAQEETAYTLEEVRAKLAELQKAGKRAEVKALLTSFGAVKLSEIPASRYVALMVKAGEL